jgi:hypothetical protein
MVSLQWSEKLTKSYFSHRFFLIMAPVCSFYLTPILTGKHLIYLLVILSIVKNQMENDALRPFGLNFFGDTP